MVVHMDLRLDTMNSGMLAAVVANNSADMAVRLMVLVTNTMTV